MVKLKVNRKIKKCLSMIFLSLIISLVIKVSGIKKIMSITKGIREKAVRNGKMIPNFSNFGIIDSKLCDFKHAKINNAYGIGPVLFGPGFMLVASGYNDTLTISSNYCSGCVNQKVVRQFVDNMLIELNAVWGNKL